MQNNEMLKFHIRCSKSTAQGRYVTSRKKRDFTSFQAPLSRFDLPLFPDSFHTFL